MGVRIPHLEQLDVVVVLYLEDGVGVALIDSISRFRVMTLFMSGASSAKHGFRLVKLSHHIGKDSQVLANVGQFVHLGETVVHHVAQGQMNLAGLNVLVVSI